MQSVSPITWSIGLYHVRSCKLNVPQRVVSTESPTKSGFPRCCPELVEGFHRYSHEPDSKSVHGHVPTGTWLSSLSLLPIKGPILSLTCALHYPARKTILTNKNILVNTSCIVFLYDNSLLTLYNISQIIFICVICQTVNIRFANFANRD